MKRLVHHPLIEEDHSMIEAMSLINPQLCQQRGILVEVEQRDEGPIPHLHVYHDSTRDKNKCSFVRLDRPEYSDHHKEPSMKLPRVVKKKFIEIMNSPWNKQIHVSPDGSMKVATGYEAAVDTWVDTYEEGNYNKFQLDMNGDPVMPDYNLL